jgi:hypothetical protein
VAKVRSRPSSRRARDSGQVDRSRAVVAWRFWGVGVDDAGRARLRSPYRETLWEPGEPFVARCLSPQLTLGPAGHRHQAPDPRCRCGAYGGTYRDLRAFLGTHLARPSEAPVLGRVELWGTVLVEHTSWRSSFAYPERLLVPTFVPGAYTVADELQAYGVPVGILDVRDMFAALHPAGHAPFIPSRKD